MPPAVSAAPLPAELAEPADPAELAKPAEPAKPAETPEPTAPPAAAPAPSGRWLPLAFFGTLLVLLLIALNAGRSLRDAQSLATQRLQVRQLLLESKNLIAALQGTEISQRDFLLTGDPAHLETHNAAVAEVGQRMATIEELSRLPGQPAFDLQPLRPLITLQQAELGAALQAYRRDGPAAAAQRLRLGHDSKLINSARTHVDGQVATIGRTLDQRVRLGNDNLAAALNWLAGGALAGAIVLASGFAWLRRQIRERDEAVAALARSHQSIEQQVSDRTAALQNANAALRDREAFLRSIGDNLPGGVIYQLAVSPDGKARYEHVSAGVERISGVSVQAVLDDAEAFYGLVIEQDRPAWEAARAAASREHRPFSVDARIRRRDGELRWCHFTSSPRRLADGRVLWNGIGLDISERKRVEADREQLLARLSDAFFSLDAEWRVTYVNRRAGEIVDRAPNALIGKDLWAEFPSFVGTRFHAACRRALTEQRFELSLDYNAGNDRWFEYRIYPSRDGVSVFASDVTDARRAERALRESEARVRLALEASNLGLWEWKVGSAEAYYSPLLKRQIGYEPHEIADLADSWKAHVHPQDVADTLAKLTASARAPWPRYENEYRVRHKDGAYRWIRSTGGMLLDEAGKPLRLIGTQQDITEARQAQAERDRLLGDRLAARADADAANERLAHVLESVSDAFVAIDHDGRYTYVNQRAAKTLARTRQALLGQSIWSDAEGPGEPLRQACLQAVQQQRFTFIEIYFAPLERWFENRIYPSVDGLSIVFHDITERKRAEAALRTTEAQLHELLAQFHRAQEDERIRMSRQIHDELGQLLTGVKMDLRWLERKLGEAGVPPWFNGLLDRAVAASALTDQTIATVQNIAMQLRPAALDQLGLAAALTQAARRFQASSGVACSVDAVMPEPVLSAAVASELFYICQEALTNVARHAQATEVAIALRVDEREARLEVRDNGVGIEASRINGRHSLGLLGMRERALQCNGTLHVRAVRPRGTCVIAQVPLAGAGTGADAAAAATALAAT